jgi:hypothetical protein
MKKLLFITCIIFYCSYLKAQAEQADPRLYDVFSSDYISDLKTSDPNQLQYLNWYLYNSYSVSENISAEKYEHLPYLKHFNPLTKTEGGNVTDIDLNNFNIFMYSSEIYYDKPSVYRIGDSGKVIYFYSTKDLTSKYNKFLEN